MFKLMERAGMYASEGRNGEKPTERFGIGHARRVGRAANGTESASSGNTHIDKIN
jgi:hypothetical protein